MRNKSETILGILTVKKKGSDSFRGNRANFRDLILMGRRLGIRVVVFAPEGILERENSMECFVYTGRSRTRQGTQNAWKRAVLPLPAVVYNRIPDREAEQRPSVLRVKKWLTDRDIPMFNPNFFNKQELTEWLQKAPQTAGFLPHTEVLQDSSQIARLLRRYNLLYVKPAAGKAGDGIIQMRQADDGFQVTHQYAGIRTRERFASRQEAAKAVFEKTQGQQYLLQQGILLAQAQGRLFDLRLLMQKNGKGEWRMTGMGARLADADGITTHVPNGGSIDRAVSTLCAAFGKQRGERLYAQVQETAHRIAHTIEQNAKQAGGAIGEMSMDIGVDSQGKLYFFEANAKPMKFDEPFIRAKSLLRLLRYADFLAHHTKEQYSKR